MIPYPNEATRETTIELRPNNGSVAAVRSGPKRPQLPAAHHSENWYDFPSRQDSTVKGMAFREARAVPE
jgi:hypothetical protein